MQKIITLAACICLYAPSLLYAAVIFEDSFDGYTDDPRSHGWGWGDQLATSFVEITSQEGYLSSRGIKVTYQASGNDAWISMANDANGRGDVYIRFYAKTSGPLASSKFLKIFGIRDGDSYANTTLNIHPGSGQLKILHGMGTGLSNDATNAISLDGTNFDSSIVIETSSSNFVPDSTWRCYEFYMKYNTNGNRDGVYKVWLDGVLRLHATNVKNRNDSNPRGIEGIQLGGYTHGSSTPWYIWYDEVVVSDSYIGPLSAGDPTCSDGILNGDETGVDCGGSCPACEAPPLGIGMKISTGASMRVGVGSTPIQ